MDYELGLIFIDYKRHHNNVWKICDIIKSYNHKNELVKTEYVAEQDFLGQKLYWREIPASTIARCIEKQTNKQKEVILCTK